MSNKQRQIEDLKNTIKQLKIENAKETNDIKDISMQWDSEKSKLYDWELKRSWLSRKHSILENEAKKGETKVTELINEINSHHHWIKSPNKLKATQMRLSNEFPIVNQFNDKNDVCQYVNTQDSDKNKQK